MRMFRFALLGVAALAMGGCDDEGDVTLAPDVPLAFTRFVNAVPDTSGQDWRFIDMLEYSPPAFNLQFRSFTPYQGTAPGTRHLRVFPTSENIAVTSSRLVDTTLTFEAGRYYTIVHTGYADPTSAPANRIIVFQDDIPSSIPADTFAIRAINLGTGVGPVDVYAATSTSAPLPGSPLFSNVAVGAATSYAMLDTGAVAMRAMASGSVTPSLANSTAPAGEPGNPTDNLTTIGGSRQGGSAIAAIFVPASVSGTSAPQRSAFQSPAWVYVIDRHPR